MAGVLRRDNFVSHEAFSFTDFEQRAAELRKQAEEQARQIIVDAEDRARRDFADGKQRGYQQGLTEGRRAGEEQIRAEAREAVFDETRQDVTTLTEGLTAGLREIVQNKRRLIAIAESGLIELALDIARRVCKIEIAASSDSAWGNARHLLELVQHTGDAELRFNPEDYEVLRDIATEFLKDADRLEHVQVISDPAVDRGGCLLSTPDGTLDAGVETQLQRIAEAICGSSAHPAGPDEETE